MSVQQLLDDTGVLLAIQRDVDGEEALFRATRSQTQAEELGLTEIRDAARGIVGCLWAPQDRRAHLHTCILTLTLAVKRAFEAVGL